jgi:hypothetical protein
LPTLAGHHRAAGCRGKATAALEVWQARIIAA